MDMSFGKKEFVGPGSDRARASQPLRDRVPVCQSK